MLRENLNRFLLLTLAVSLFSFPVRAEDTSPVLRHLGASALDATLDCIRSVYGKPVIWDSSVRFWTDPAVPQCPNSEAALLAALAARGIRVLDAQDFVFIVASRLFQPPEGGTEPPHAFLKWSAIKIHLNLQTLHEGDKMPKEAPEIANEILKWARMVPFNVSMSDDKGFPVAGAVDTDLNIAVWVGKLGHSETNESVVAVVNGQPNYTTARIVYGELRDGKYVMLWDSPLFNVLHGNVYFQNVNGDAWREIVVESSTYGNKEYPILAIFDRNGREITRQKKCQTGFTYTGGFGEEDGVCAIYGDDISFSENEDGPKDIYVSDWDGDNENHVFTLSNGVYIPGPPVTGDFPPPPPPEKSPSAADLNEQGLKLMQAKDYASAVAKFMGADFLIGHKNAEYANNVGFALYKAQQYQMSVDWLKIAIGIDPKRAVAYLNLGDALVKLNRNAEARQAYTQYIELAPNSEAAPDVKRKLDALPPSP
jgi:Tetratricopeptide repeat